MRVLGFISRRMAAKIFLVIGVVVGAALLWQAQRETARAESALKEETRGAASLLALSVKGAVESTMLQGDGILVKALVARIKGQVPLADVHVYDSRGVEVFAPKGPAPEPATLSAALRSALAGERPEAAAELGVLVPVLSEKRCARCHPDTSPTRGVLQVWYSERCVERSEAALAELVSNGFVHVMTARRQDMLDEYFGELSARSPTVAAVEVFDREGDSAYGEGIADLPATAVAAALDPSGNHERRRVDASGGVIELIPLPLQPRCVECHDDGQPMRGLLAVQLASIGGEGAPREAACARRDFETIVDASLRYIMMSRLGGIANSFLDAAVATGMVDRVVLYDNAGRVFWDTRHAVAPAHVRAVLESGQSSATFSSAGRHERVLVVHPLETRPECGKCHGSDLPLRGAVSVSLSTAMAAELRAAQFHQRVWFTGYTLAGILFILIALLQYLVVRPVQQVAQVADAVGAGDLGRTVERADPDGDEVAQLGHRVNAMVKGLRAKLQLEKFVSKGAVQAADSAGLRGVERSGARRVATVLFSDIRGFTAFSENVAAETVVAMLNRFLQAQADVVHKYEGDIDKFVGDEVMAVFQGDNAEARAVRCAIELVEAVHAVRENELSVGVGIAAGQVVHGAIGAKERMDFTVIGDVVNIGARLCGIAERDQILVTEEIYGACRNLADLELTPLASKPLKGKRRQVAVFEVRRRRAPE